MIPELSSERLTLRSFEDSDVGAFCAILSDPETTRFIGGPKNRAATWLRIAGYQGHWVLRGYGQWAVVETASGRLVGRCGLWNPEGWPELEVGWTLGRDFWGRGYATEAGRAAVAWARTELGLSRIASCIHPDNARSIAVAERLGMSFDYAADLPDDLGPASVFAMSL